MVVYELRIGNSVETLYLYKEDAIKKVKRYYGSFWTSKNLYKHEVENAIIWLNHSNKNQKAGCCIITREVL